MSENRTKEGKLSRKLWLPLIGAAVGCFLLIMGSVGGSGSDRKEEKEDAEAYAMPSPERYAAEVEARVIELCSRVEGAGTVHATVSLKGTYRALYATDWQSSSTGSQSTMVLVGSGSSEGAVLIGYENPEIAGIGIVCTGGDRIEVQKRILSLVSAAFGISTNKIYIAASES